MDLKKKYFSRFQSFDFVISLDVCLHDGWDVNELLLLFPEALFREMFETDTFEPWFDELEALLASDPLLVVSDCNACLG